MTIESAVYIGQEALMIAMFIGGPLLGELVRHEAGIREVYLDDAFQLHR